MLKRFALLTASHEGSPIALRAKREGLDVLSGVVPDWNLTYTPEEAKEDKKPEEDLEKQRRMKTYNGMIPQTTPEKMISALGKLSGTEKEQTYVFADMNYVHKYSPQLLDLNIPGNFPSTDDRILEADREKGKEFVKQHYTDLKLTDVHEFNKVQEALDFLEENMGTGDQAKLFVLKSDDAGIDTIVPLNSDTAQQAYQTIKTALESDTQGYEGKGFILEEFIKDAIEITPQCIFYNGTPVFYSVDIEIKKEGSGLSGETVGCAANLVFRTDPEDKINKMAFPPIIYQMMKERQGIVVWDASVLIDPAKNEYYFGEFCCNRWGWDDCQTQIEMAGGVTKFLESIMNGVAPYDFGKFGFAVRLFSKILDKDIPGHYAADVPLSIGQEVVDHVWPMYIYQDGDEMKTTGYGKDLAVVTAVGDSIEEAATKCYEYMQQINFKDYSRLSLDDVLSIRSAGTILNRFKYGNDHGLYDVPNGDNSVEEVEKVATMELAATFTPTGNPLLDMVGQAVSTAESQKKDFDKKIQEIEQRHQKELSETLEKVRTELTAKAIDTVKTAEQQNQFNTAIQMVGNTLQELKNSMAGLQPKEVDLSGVQQALALLPGKSDAIAQANTLIQIKDSIAVDLKNLLMEQAKAFSQPRPDVTGKAITAAFADLKKHFSKEIDKLAKVTQQTSVVVAGGQRYDIPPNQPTIQNITLTTQSQEYACTIPSGAKRLMLKIRGLSGYRLYYSWVQGGTTSGNYVTVEQGEVFTISGTRFEHNTTIYLNSPDAAAQVAEVETWSA